MKKLKEMFVRFKFNRKQKAALDTIPTLTTSDLVRSEYTGPGPCHACRKIGHIYRSLFQICICSECFLATRKYTWVPGELPPQKVVR